MGSALPGLQVRGNQGAIERRRGAECRDLGRGVRDAVGMAGGTLNNQGRAKLARLTGSASYGAVMTSVATPDGMRDLSHVS